MHSAHLSVIVITKSEVANIGACLTSRAYADEWIVVDSQSSDDTVERHPASRSDCLETMTPQRVLGGARELLGGPTVVASTVAIPLAAVRVSQRSARA